MSATITKDKLLATLRENRTKHRTVFEAALDGWYAAMVADLDEKKALLLKRRRPALRWENPYPQDHTAEYDAIIAEVEWDENKLITLDSTRFRQFVLDQWAWKRDWLISNSAYAAGSVQETYAMDWMEIQDNV